MSSIPEFSAGAKAQSGRITNILSVDVEEYFHPTEVEASVDRSQWDTLPSRVEDETKVVLDLFDECGVKATFFVLGWIAKRHPRLAREIADRGHEIGCHSYLHRLVFGLTPAEFRADTERAAAEIADAVGFRPVAYRAPSYSITNECLWALETLVECGFRYDSSIYPIAHDRYGIRGFERGGHLIRTPSGPIYEVPIATVRLGNGDIVPIGGGAYLRLLPYSYTLAGIRRLNGQEEMPACVYFHPWELDAQQPRIASGLVARMRTYTGLATMHRKIARLTRDFRFAPLGTVYPLYATAGTSWV